MTRLLTQIVLGMLLLFGAATLIPRGIVHIRLGNTPRGVMYLCIGIMCMFFTIMAFIYAYKGQ